VDTTSPPSRRLLLLELAAYFLRLGFTAFGGPAAHIAIMQHDVVERRQWLTQQEFLDAIGAANLIPGPTSTELALYVGRRRAGLAGLVVAGVGFIGPAMLLSIGVAWLYSRTAQVPQMGAVLSGIQAVVVAIIAVAAWKLVTSALTSRDLVGLAAVAAGASALGVGELPILIGAGILFMIVRNFRRPRLPAVVPALAALLMPRKVLAAGTSTAAAGSIGYSVLALHGMWGLAAYFLVTGSVLYGSGYVLVAFLEGGLVTDTGLLTRRQLLDAVAAGQFTPGPVSSTATFIGFLLHGVPGAMLCTLAIFLPSFVFVGLLGGWVPRLRSSRRAASFLDGVNAAAVALIAVVALRLGLTTWTDWRLLTVSLAALALLVRTRVNATWLIIVGGVAGWIMGQ